MKPRLIIDCNNIKFEEVFIICHGLTGDPNYPIEEHPIYSSIANSIKNSGACAIRFVFNMNITDRQVTSYSVNSMVKDLDDILKHLYKNKSYLKKRISIIGHSIGALLAIFWSIDRKIDKVIAIMPPYEAETREFINKIKPHKDYLNHISSSGKKTKISKHYFLSWIETFPKIESKINSFDKNLFIIEEKNNHTKLHQILEKVSYKLLIIRASHKFSTSNDLRHLEKILYKIIGKTNKSK